MFLTEFTITFGKYNGLTLDRMLRDREYCRWLLSEENAAWFRERYEFLYNKVKEYNPQSIFIVTTTSTTRSFASPLDFCENYEYFRLPEPSAQLEQQLTAPTDISSYKFYLSLVMSLKDQILKNVELQKENPYDIKTPNKWLIRFEETHGLSREVFKEFISAYDLLNIPAIIERIKKEGNIEYRGGKAFIIAKQNSLAQESVWESLLKTKYGEAVGVQFKFSNCIFDFINIQTNTIYECKLSLNDFNQKQFNKYERVLDQFKIVYLIGLDTIINFETHKVYSSSPTAENLSLDKCGNMSPEFRKILSTFEFQFNIRELTEYL